MATHRNTDSSGCQSEANAIENSLEESSLSHDSSANAATNTISYHFQSDAKHTVTEIVSKTFALAGLPIACGISLRIMNGSLPPIFILAVGFLLFGVFIHVFRERLSTDLRLAIYVVMFSVTALMQLSNAGLYSLFWITVLIPGLLIVVGYDSRILMLYGFTIIAIGIMSVEGHIAGFYGPTDELLLRSAAYARLVSTLVFLTFIVITTQNLIKKLKYRDTYLKSLSEEYKLRAIELEQAIFERDLLRDFITVCGGCKKVRIGVDDYGNEQWDSMEKYVQYHNTATLSHGYCESCLAQAEVDLVADKQATS